MKINRSNYEAFVIDFLEGKLDQARCEELMAFVLNNPDLQEELDMLREMPLLCPTDELCPCKDDLKLNDAGLPALNEKTLDLWLAASFEGDLNEELHLVLNTFIDAHPGFVKDLNLMQNVRLVPDAGQVLTDKSSLKRTAIQVHIDESNLESWLIAQFEGETNRIEDEKIAEFLSLNPAFLREKKLIQGSRLIPDSGVIFEGKNALRRFVIPLVTERTALRVFSMAATFLLLIGIFQSGYMFMREDEMGVQLAGFQWSHPSAPVLQQQEAGIVAGSGSNAQPAGAIQRSQGLQPVPFRTAGLQGSASNAELPDELDLRQSNGPVIIYGGGSESSSGADGSLTLRQYGAIKLRQFAYGKEEPVSSDSKVSGWELADAGLAGINKIAGSDLRFDRQFTPEGKVKSYHLGNDRYYLARQ